HPLEQLLLLSALGVDQVVAQPIGSGVLGRRRDRLELLGLLRFFAAFGLLVFGREGGPQPLSLAAARLEDDLAGVGEAAQRRRQIASQVGATQEQQCEAGIGPRSGVGVV